MEDKATLFYEKYPNMVHSLILCDTHFGLGNLDDVEIQNLSTQKKTSIRRLGTKRYC